jgi:hypothetical protein
MHLRIFTISQLYQIFQFRLIRTLIKTKCKNQKFQNNQN